MVINMELTLGGEMLPSMNPGPPGYSSGGVTLYEKELETYSCVARGDCDNVRRCTEELINEKAAYGGLDMNGLSEAKYRACEIINIAARYASQSGADETYCLRLSDDCVSETERLISKEDVYRLLIEKTAELTRLVHQANLSRSYPYAVRKSIGYINSNLSRNLSVKDVARACRLSPDYLSTSFRRATGVRMTAYIRRQKMLFARDILGRHIRCREAAQKLSFCSESYFVKCFKDEFGVTPKKWQESH